MAGITAAAIGAGTAIIGDMMSQSGQQQTNQMSQAMMMQNEQWQTQMSNTAVQRRKADLLAAGFNPLLATGDAASTPSVSQPSLQNPNAAFGNLGAQVSSAMQLKSNIELQEAQASAARAQADKTTSETPSGLDGKDGDMQVVTVGPNHDLGDANLASIQANTNVSKAQAQQVKANVDYIYSQIKNTDTNTALQGTQNLLTGQNLAVLQATKQYLIQQSQAAGAAAKNLTGVEQGALGQVLTFINAILKPATSAASIIR